ncbi:MULTISPECIES: sigma-70 family RNA polymerase sigma factor [Clostridium]|uniref:DNA-directed RNA polymerase sigma-70 factor n=2 Tax=Clostridium TaxID=1485 RepID=A0A0N8VXI6_CLOBU|nr:MULTISPECIES: sigma-70 family RNA polymerase sigma factor [Clostridium]AXB83472.1 RNA polymerase subunit sigma-24 [Clostridium butyricum]ENZ29515.1 TIGR02954 family RNA polymerase sigma-70 factor [Clostridium butyricum 60E.3]KIU06328.1 RNA polymerase, sigma-24 subunit, ECF subfamily [Clostridium butyricum]KJZ86210.1 hypothetical protein ClosIBUN13A_CONTIG65g00708 [Clostridium sp. IBUN13A]KJZ88893.1 hypothetical protein ClosIBUN125C_CONTIG17g01085 [Clostridium sp. IBUN125C]
MIDEIIFKRAKKGDSESFYKLLEPIKDKLYRSAYVYVENEHDALDCIHEAVIKAIQSLDKLKEPQYFNTWIMKILINTCKDYIKKNSKVILVDIENYKESIATDIQQNQHKEEIYEALSKLTEREKDLIIMRYMDDMSLKDIASKANKPLGTIKSSISRTLKKMRKHMEVR